MLLSAELPGQRAVEHIHVELGPSLDVKHPLCRATGETCDIQRRTGQAVLRAVHAPSDVGESKIAQQALTDTVALESGECRVRGCDLGTVIELHATELQRLSRDAAECLE